MNLIIINNNTIIIKRLGGDSPAKGQTIYEQIYFKNN